MKTRRCASVFGALLPESASMREEIEPRARDGTTPSFESSRAHSASLSREATSHEPSREPLVSIVFLE